jgi:hypothetical protein
MKMNWGYKILIVYLVFVTGMLTLVYMSSMENKDLVSENYYEEEIKYQHVIDESANTASLSSEPVINRNKNIVNITFPAEFTNEKTDGDWVLYYAADKSKDVQGKLNVVNGKYSIELPDNATGTYQLKLKWQVAKKKYYYEKVITL